MTTRRDCLKTAAAAAATLSGVFGGAVSRCFAGPSDGAAAGEAPPASGGVRCGLAADGEGNLLKDGKPWRGVGVNYVGAFGRILADSGDKAVEEGFAVLAQHQIPFVRTVGSRFYAKEMDLYFQDRAEYFRRMDQVVAIAERTGVGLIPSLFFSSWPAGIANDKGLPGWIDPASQVHEIMATYVKEVITRYRNSPAIWGWEYGNELNNTCDLPNAAKLGHTPDEQRTHAMMRRVFVAFGREARKYDSYRILDSGNTMPRPSAWHQIQELSWTKDTPEQLAEVIRADVPDPLNVMSVHCYGDDFAPNRLPVAAATARAIKKPLFVGEFGVSGPRTEESEKEFRGQIAQLEREKVPMAAVWEFDVRPIPQNRMKWLIAPGNDRFYMLSVIEELNARLAGS
ncbi:MAG: hypothetical protein NTW86_01485 [Candidatus Sumerlaeota bacterium]|nr:hypothetical protein [Candidatus Sumerlaeota bacterium]